MPFFIQDPIGYSGHVLHETLISQASLSSCGGGAFAYATKEGIDLLLGSDEFNALFDRGEFFLVVGIDEITNTRAIAALSEYQDRIENLSVMAFSHQESRYIFHPKFSWFENTERLGTGSLITGSGNLTSRGLRGNWEAYFLSNLDSEEFTDVRGIWESWKVAHQEFLLPLDSPIVQEKAASNIVVRLRKPTAGTAAERAKPQLVINDSKVSTDKLLVLEWPKGRVGANAYSQVNFGKDLFERYFSIDIQNPDHDFYFQSVNDDGEVTETETRPPVIKLGSSNYNFELDSPKGKGVPPPPTPPIGVFCEIGVRTYRYKFFLPEDEGYPEIRDFLFAETTASGKKGRRLITDASRLVEIIPEAGYLPALLCDEE